jgi:hypothetical protein
MVATLEATIAKLILPRFAVERVGVVSAFVQNA